MLRSLNFTGRKRIPREAALISLRREADDSIGFDAELDLDSLELPADAHVFVEAFFKTASERFPWGTVAQPVIPADCRLQRLAQPDLANFRVKVVEPATTGAGRLLAVADHIAPEGLRGSQKRRISLLPVDPIDGLSEEIWRLNLDDLDGAGPVLELNRAIPGITDRVREESFMALVFPTVIRSIYEKVFADGYDSTEDDRDLWQARWLRFGSQFSGEPPPLEKSQQGSAAPLSSAHREWIDGVITAWCRQQKIVANFKKRFPGAEGGSK